MNIVLLGKTVKAMYKLSGKTLTQLSDETDLSVDTINNFFYARLQKPSFEGVCKLVAATGYTVEELFGFMKKAEKLPESADFTEEFTRYIFTVKDTELSADRTENLAKKDALSAEARAQIKELNENHERELERYRATQQHYAEQLSSQYKEQIAQMNDSARVLKEHFDHSVGEIKKAHAQEMERQDRQIRLLRWTNLACILLALFSFAALIILQLIG